DLGLAGLRLTPRLRGFFFSSRRRHTRSKRDWSSDVCSSDLEDLESAGISGLIQSMDSYDAERNIKFNTYVYYRIRGNIIDYLRKVDQLPRTQRKNYGEVKRSEERRVGEEGRTEE